jgi:KaiC/GvpD/RAD55 family RecA-like ATPase
MSRVLRTNISQTFWCDLKPNGSQVEAAFKPAVMAVGSDGKPDSVAWFDQLFQGGIHLAEVRSGKPRQPRVMLLTGPPGSGKTTLAMELCYRLASMKNESERKSSFYVSLDADSDQVIENAGRLWPASLPYLRDFKQDVKEPGPGVHIWGRSSVEEFDSLEDMVNQALRSTPNAIRVAPGFTPEIVVIDSLNIVEASQGKYFDHFMNHSAGVGSLVIFMLDSGGNGLTPASHRLWEYAADLVVRVDYTSSSDYYLRTIEVVKARFQTHVLGKHQLKIYAAFQSPTSPITSEESATLMGRAHPFREEGGVFIYPSIHYYLSLYKRSSPKPPQNIKLVPHELGRIVSLPEGRCTAFKGSRGGHKSHLGYLYLLDRVLNWGEKAMVISLRDDEQMTKSTMQRIIREDAHFRAHASAEATLEALAANNKLEILYYHPGYITPEEFFHRMFISIKRLKRNDEKLTVMFNSLDQLSARFPLCAKQKIFIPGIIETLCGEGITSIFIAVDEEGQPEEQYGLLPMADLILSFSASDLPFERFAKYRTEVLRGARSEVEWNGSPLRTRIERLSHERADTQHAFTKVRVDRFAGGQAAGSGGMLELIRPDDLENVLYETAGLQFTELLGADLAERGERRRNSHASR